ncbi:MAG: serine/threonine-protein kinase [Polyangiaceae bacterium]
MADEAETLDGEKLGAAEAETVEGPPDLHLRLAQADISTEQASARAGDPPLTFPVPGWDRYVFVQTLGRGGMGAVFEAVDRQLNRHVALKFIRGGDPHLAARLVREARAQASIRHENVCKVFEVGEVAGRPYIAMQLVEGPPLWEVARKMSLLEKVIAMRDVARAIHEAHALGILHRDIKPGNILVEVTEEGRYRPIVMDFGLARDEGGEKGITETGMLLGTPAYMSPEQARGSRNVDRRSDVYSLGATFYELLTGDPPFTGDTPVKIVLAVLNDDPAPIRARIASIPTDLDTIVGKCLSKEPERRYDSAKALADDLDRYLRGEPILGRRETLLQRWRRAARKQRALVTTALIALVLVLFAGGYTVRERILAARHAKELEAQAAVERDLAQDVKEIVWFLRTAHLLPLHDITRERAIVKERMRRIEARAPSSGPVVALVDYAIGRAHLALDEDEQAHGRLSRAQRAGLDTPELHYALGLALGRRYERELADVRRGGDPKWVERKTKEIEEQYLMPALASMERSRAVRLEAPSYLEGLMAFYRKDYEAALRLAAQANDEAPWLYEAKKLQADVYLARGIEEKDHGELEAGMRDLEQATRLFDAAAEIGRSDAALYEGGADALSRRMELDTDRGVSPEPELPGVLDRCAKAAMARPDLPTSFTRIAYAHDSVAKYQLKRGQDPRAALALEIRAAESARSVDDGDFAAHERLATARLVLALFQLDHGIDPRPSIAELRRSAERAAQIDPKHPWVIALLAFSRDLQGRYAIRTGSDPTEDFKAALEMFLRAAEIDRGYAYAYLNALWVYGFWAQWLASRNQDPGPMLTPAAKVFDACVQANAFSECQENQGVIDYWHAEYMMSSGQDPLPLIAKAEANLTQAGALQKDFLENRQFTAALRLLRVREAARRHGAAALRADEVRRLLASFEEVLAECFRLSDKDPMCSLLDARRALLIAELEAAAGGAKKATLESARDKAARAVDANPPDADAHEALAEAERRLAEAERGAARTAHRDAGLRACDAGLAVNPTHKGLLAAKAALQGLN